MADGVGHVEVLGGDDSTPQNAVRIRSSTVGDLYPIAALKTLEVIERPRMGRSMSCYRDCVSPAWAACDRPPGRPAVEP